MCDHGERPREDVGVDHVARHVGEQKDERAEVDGGHGQRRERIPAEHGDDPHRVPQRVEVCAPVLVEVDGRDFNGRDLVSERHGFGQNLRFGLVAPPRHRREQRFRQRVRKEPESGLGVGHVSAGAEEEHQAREVVADLALGRHDPDVAHPDDEVGALAHRERHEPRDVAWVVLAIPVDGQDVVERFSELAQPPLEHLFEAGLERGALTGVDRQAQARRPGAPDVLRRVVG